MPKGDSYGYSAERHSGNEEAPSLRGKRWLVLRTGMDFRLRCLGCGREVMTPRFKAEKNIRAVFRNGDPVMKK